LELLHPGAIAGSIDVDGVNVGIIEDARGLSAIVEIGDPGDLLDESGRSLPVLSGLTGDQPTVRLQLLISATPAVGGSGAAAASYRQLAEGRVLARRRVLLTVRVTRAGPADLRRVLAGVVRRVRRKLAPCRPLGPETVLGLVAETAHHDPGYQVHESWSGITAGGLTQATFRLGGPVSVERLLTVPCAGVTLSLTAGGTLMRLAAASTTLLDNAVATLLRLTDTAERLDSDHLAGLAATLPLGDDSALPQPGKPTPPLDGTATPPHSTMTTAQLGRRTTRPWSRRTTLGTIPSSSSTTGDKMPAGPTGDLPKAGLVVGMNRHGAPVTVRLFRPQPTHATLVGDLHCAQTLVLRCLAVGAAVAINTTRPYAWQPFLRGLPSTERIQLTGPTERIAGEDLVVVDVGPLAVPPTLDEPWHCTLTLREDLTTDDADLLGRADLAILQTLEEHQVTITAGALGLGEEASWLARTGPDMLAVVAGRGILRWARLSNTPVEKQLIRVPDRGAAMARSPTWES
jgi:hypothetical protein